jgi:hypothetical protein
MNGDACAEDELLSESWFWVDDSVRPLLIANERTGVKTKGKKY